MSNEVKVVTNNVYRDIIPGYSLSVKERQEFYYIGGEDLDLANFTRYKGELYHLQDTIVVEEVEGLENWDRYISFGWWTGVVFKYSDCHEQVLCGTYTC